MVRRGVGATIAAAILFSSLIASNFLLVAGDQQMSELAMVSSQERSLNSQALSAEEVGAISALDMVQASLASSHIGCASPSRGVSSAVSRHASAYMGGVTVKVVATVGGGTKPDNMTALAPFAGSVNGLLDVSEVVTASGSDPLGIVRYESRQTHSLHLAVEVGPLASGCEALLAEGTAALAGLNSSLCDPSAVSAALAPYAMPKDSQLGVAFRFSLQHVTFISPRYCSVSLTAVATEAGVQGPLGPFTVTLEQTGQVSWRSALRALP